METFGNAVRIVHTDDVASPRTAHCARKCNRDGLSEDEIPSRRFGQAHSECIRFQAGVNLRVEYRVGGNRPHPIERHPAPCPTFLSEDLAAGRSCWRALYGEHQGICRRAKLSDDSAVRVAVATTDSRSASLTDCLRARRVFHDVPLQLRCAVLVSKPTDHRSTVSYERGLGIFSTRALRR